MSLNVLVSITQTARSTPSTLSNSSHCHVEFDPAAIGRLDRASVLSLAYMPPKSSNEDEHPVHRGHMRLPEEEEPHHDMNDLADYDGDSDDGGKEGESILYQTEQQQEDSLQ